MFNTLLESGARRRTPRNRLATAGSLIAHTTLIICAVAATATPNDRTPVPERVERVEFHPAPRARPAPATAAPTGAPRTPTVLPQAPVFPVDILKGITPPDLSTPLSGSAEFAPPGTVTGDPGTQLTSGEATIHEERFVDEPVVLMPGNQPPRYPAALRSIGIQGEVVTRFVVDTLGRAEPSSIVIVSASHALFGASVREALLKAQFVPARIRSQRVRQLAEQSFLFHIER